ncbi:MAG: HigA family addiction module antidote protein [Treponema sp.]|jgi:addiction module HigA family antidote|nr:HigA family addiction module antidote protein [Treponema sp.]
MNIRKPTHPGEVLYEDVIKPLNITITEAALRLGVSRKALSELINARTNLTPEMAVRIGKATNTTPESWINMQSKLDLWRVNQEKQIVIRPLSNYIA